MPLTELPTVDLTPLPPLPSRGDVEALLARRSAEEPEFAAFLARHPVAADALRRLGLGAWERGDASSAIDALSAAAVLKQDDPVLWSDLAGALGAAGRPKDAEACLRMSLAKDPTRSQAWLSLATLRNVAGDLVGAAQAFEAALLIEPTLPLAHSGLGLSYFGTRRLPEAADAFRAAITHGASDAMTFASLGHVLYLLGEFEDCVGAFDRAAAAGPLDEGGRSRHAHALMIRDLIAGDHARAIARYRSATPTEDAQLAGLRKAFGILRGFGYREAAIVVGDLLTDHSPDDPSHRYLLQAVKGMSLSRAPDDYLEAYFDHFAPTFDEQLVDVLRYDVPAQLAALLLQECRSFASLVDLGCGTGLAAPYLRPATSQLVGVDLAGRMLERARETGRYDALHKSEVIAYLREIRDVDGLFAADLLVYFGDLAPVFETAGKALRPGGYLALSVELMAGESFAILPTGRFAHTEAYVTRASAPWFHMAAVRKRMLRLEASRPTNGLLMILRRRLQEEPAREDGG